MAMLQSRPRYYHGHETIMAIILLRESSFTNKTLYTAAYCRPRPGNSAILLETGSIDHGLALSIPAALRVTKKDVNKLRRLRNIWQSQSRHALRVRKKFPLILIRGARVSYLGL